MFENLRLTLNAQFFSHDARLRDSEIRKILDSASEIASAPLIADEFRRSRSLRGEGLRYAYSLRIFPTTRPVYFLPGVAVADVIYAYILLIEVDGHVAVFKKSCGNINETASGVLTPISPGRMTSTFDDDEVAFQQLSVRNMTVAETAMRRRSYEAANLRGLLSTHAAGRSIPYFIKIRSGTTVSSMSLSTARLFDASERKQVDEVAGWVKAKFLR
jgi:hypothetical protein